jgi:hypothetical protein
VPWRGPDEPGSFPTLGYQVLELGESVCVIPDGDRRGEPMLLTDEQARFVLWFYRINPKTGRFHFPRGGQIVRPQKWGKDPFAAWLICVECHPEAPVVPAGWDADGEPVGRPWSTPWVQVTGVSEDATDNTWRALKPMIELGPLADIWPDTGETRINLPHDGLIEPVTSSAQSRFGQRVTFVLQGETHLCTKANGMRKVIDTQRRNAAGIGGRFLEITNSWDPNEESVAKDTNTEHGVYIDDVEPGPGSVKNRRDRERMMRKVYGDSWRRLKPEPARVVNGWVDIERIDEEAIALLPRDPLQVERYYLNRKQPGEGVAVDIAKWKKQATSKIVVADRSLIVVGADGPRFSDSYAIVATEVSTGHQWPAGVWEAPAVPTDDFEQDETAIDGAMSELFERFNVWRAYVNPTWEGLLDCWRGRWGAKRVLPWHSNRPRAMAYAVRNWVDAVTTGDLSHDGDSQLTAHVAQARRQLVNIYDDKRRQMWTLGHEPGARINGAVAAVLSWECRGDAIADGQLTAAPPPATATWDGDKAYDPFARGRDRLRI